MKVNGIDGGHNHRPQQHHHHQQHNHQQRHHNNNIVKESSSSGSNSARKADAPNGASTIVGGNDGATSESLEKIVQTHRPIQHQSSVNKIRDDSDRDGSASDSGVSAGTSSDGVVKRRNRHANGILIRSHSFDNGKYNCLHGKPLSKSRTVGSGSILSRGGSKKNRNKTLSANGTHCSVDRLDERRTECKRRRLFHAANVDQSPLWTTLTHARTMSDFVFDS